MTVSVDVKERLARRVAGEIVLADDPGKMMRRWRELFHISQITLAEYLEVSPSVISDYEGNRRKSPGTKTIKRFIEALLDIDSRRGEPVISAFGRLMDVEIPSSILLDTREFVSPVNASSFCSAIGASCVANEDLLDSPLLGYIAVDSRAMLKELSSEGFKKLYKAAAGRGLVLANLSTGRSLTVTLKENEYMPGLLVLHGVSEPDPLTLNLAKEEGFPLAVLRNVTVEELVKSLRQFSQQIGPSPY
ncbi:MAG: helix-turn-helix domain-containing protein [Candidatus Freyarchaeota archaeon]|nr:helix-turn-helix domain-containing protein [Candidatus Freyrarchaeum guaymaensis]